MINKSEAIELLVNLFDSNKLTFREIKILRSVFDEAVEACNSNRSEAIADHYMGRTGHPNLPDRDIEEDFFYSLQADVKNNLDAKGVGVSSDKALDAVVDIIVEKLEYTPEDFFYD